MRDDRLPSVPPDPGLAADRACIERIRTEIGTWLITVDHFRAHAEKHRDDPVEYARACAHAGALTMAAERLAKIVRPRTEN